jgi:putative hemolysin
MEHDNKRLSCFVATDKALITSAQILRYRVFGQELGAKLKSSAEGLDHDDVDDYCHHMVVVDNASEDIVGYTRLLNQEQAKRLGHFYSQHEFNVDTVLALPGRFLEVGRTCVDPDYRGSSVLTTLWSGLVRYALEGEYDYLIGCASIMPGVSGFPVDAFFYALDEKNLAPAHLMAHPLNPVPNHLRCQRDESGIPPLLKAYLRFGALICGEPCWDEDFNCMDVFILLPLNHIQPRYSRHYTRDYHGNGRTIPAVC